MIEVKPNKEIKTLADLEIYQLAESIALRIGKLVKKLPWQKRKLSEQLENAATSIAANIAEGFGRYHYKENVRFLYFSRGSLYEVKSRLRYFVLNKDFSLSETRDIFNDLNRLNLKINNSIASTMKQLEST